MEFPPKQKSPYQHQRKREKDYKNCYRAKSMRFPTKHGYSMLNRYNSAGNRISLISITHVEFYKIRLTAQLFEK